MIKYKALKQIDRTNTLLPNFDVQNYGKSEEVRSLCEQMHYFYYEKVDVKETIKSFLKLIIELQRKDVVIYDFILQYQIFEISFELFSKIEGFGDYFFFFTALCTAHEDSVSEYLVSLNFLRFSQQFFNTINQKNIIFTLCNISSCSPYLRDKVLEYYPLTFLSTFFRDEKQHRLELSQMFMNFSRFEIKDKSTLMLLSRIFTVAIKKRMISDYKYVLWGLHFVMNQPNYLSEMISKNILRYLRSAISSESEPIILILFADLFEKEIDLVINRSDLDFVLSVIKENKNNESVNSASYCLKFMVSRIDRIFLFDIFVFIKGIIDDSGFIEKSELVKVVLEIVCNSSDEEIGKLIENNLV